MDRRVVPALLFLLSSCSSPSVQERYEQMNYDGQREFLATYPETHGDRRVTFDRAKLENPDIYKILRIDIESPAKESVVSGNKLKLKAVLKYADGRSADASRHVHWSSQPNLVQIDEYGNVRFGCVSTDVGVTAEFLDTARGKTTLNFRKPIQSLELMIDGESSTASSDEYFFFALVATCKDGESQRVSCQASWKSLTPGFEVTGCGKVRVLQDGRTAKHIRVEVNYSGSRMVRTLQVPQLR